MSVLIDKVKLLTVLKLSKFIYEPYIVGLLPLPNF